MLVDLRCACSELVQFAKLVESEASVFDNAGHRNRIDGVMPWNRDLASAIAHDDVLPGDD